MKKLNRYNAQYEDFDEYEHDEVKTKKAKVEADARRRPIRNFKKAWNEHADDYDEYDDFYGRKVHSR